MAHITFIKSPRHRLVVEGRAISVRFLAVDGGYRMLEASAMLRICVDRIYIHPRDYDGIVYEKTESPVGLEVKPFDLDVFQDEVMAVSYGPLT